MKVRTGFVSNSSSCSFTMDKTKLSPLQIKVAKNFRKVLGAFYPYSTDHFDDWDVYDEDDMFRFSAIMDNTDLHEIFIKLGYPSDALSDPIRY